MENNIINHSLMEEISYSNQMFPMTEFIDHFDTFPDGCFPSHWHREMEIQIVLNGSAEYKVNGTSYLVEEGSAIYIAPSAIHLAKQQMPNTIGYDIVLDPDFLITLMNSAACERYTLPLSSRQPDALVISPERKEGSRILESLRKMYYTENSLITYELFLLENIIGIWRNLLALMPRNIQTSDERGKLLREERMKCMMNYIHQNYEQPLTIIDIANAASISKSECFRCFSDLSETTPVDYLNSFRLLQASQHLLTTDKSISDICFETGFNNTSYFAKKFKEQYGMTPKEYREKNR